MIKKILGWILISIPVLFVALLCISSMGVLDGLIIFALVLSITFCLVFGLMLLVNGEPTNKKRKNTDQYDVYGADAGVKFKND
jgi:hypothetical protein